MMHTQSRAQTARWLADLDSDQVAFLILDAKGDRALLGAAHSHPAWRQDYEDGETSLFIRAGRADDGRQPISNP